MAIIGTGIFSYAGHEYVWYAGEQGKGHNTRSENS